MKRIKRRIEVLDEEISQNIPPQDESGTDDKEIDFYDEKTEKIIHNQDKYLSMGVLEEEMKQMEKIIELKKKKKSDFDYWDLKKDKITLKINVKYMII